MSGGPAARHFFVRELLPSECQSAQLNGGSSVELGCSDFQVSVAFG